MKGKITFCKKIFNKNETYLFLFLHVFYFCDRGQ